MTCSRILAACAALMLAASAAAWAAAPLETYLKMTDVAWASPSPDGRLIAYTSEESGNWQVWVRHADGSGRKQLTSASDTADFAQWVPGDRHRILYAKSPGGNGADQFYYVRDDTAASVPLFPREGAVTHVFGAFSRDGSKLAFSSNKRKPGVFDVYVLDRPTGQVSRIFTVEGTAYATAWSEDARRLLVRKIATPYNDDLYVVDARTGAARLITNHTGDATFDSSQFDGSNSVLCVTDLHREFRTIARIDLRTGAIRTVIGLPFDVDQVVLAPGRTTMSYIVNRDGYGDVVVGDPETGRQIGRPSMPPSIAESLMYTADGRVLVYSASGPAFPKVTWTYDLRTRVTTRVMTPDFHGVPPDSIVQPSVVHVRSFDGRPIQAWYFRPKSAARGRMTVMLDIHGGPEEQDRAWFYPFAQYLASRGYALLDPNIRGSSGFGRTFLHLADGRKREDAVKDVKALRDWLVSAGGAGSRTIFVNGASYGGYIVLSSLYHYPSAWAGGIDVYGVADWVDFLQRTAPERRSNREGVYGSLQRDRAFLASISPINHVDRIRGPLLIAAGRNDTIVPIEQSLSLAHALARRGVPVELHVFAHEGHGFSSVADLTMLYRYTTAFIRRYSRR